MLEKFWQTIIIYLLAAGILVGSLFTIYRDSIDKVIEKISDYKQPPLSPGTYPWSIRSIDTQVISKHWPDVSKEAVVEQVSMLKALGVNYIAIGTPYDRDDDLRMWVEEIHLQGLNVWYRSHWAEWEGDDGRPAVMSPEEYLTKTEIFIKSNPDLFLPGDAFTVAVEAEQVGVGLGKRFLTWDEYRHFLVSEINIANNAFESIGLKNQIHTNWLSVNGWVVDNQFTKKLLSQLDLIVVDHFVNQGQTIGESDNIDNIVAATMKDIDYYYSKWRKPIFLGEWGYQIFQEVPDAVQAEIIRKLYTQLAKRDYIVGVNYWVHMGNSASIIRDEYGTNLKYREGAYVIKSFYDPLDAIAIDLEDKKE